MAKVARPPVLAGGAIAVLTAAIIGNALLLQPNRHPAPLFQTRLDAPRPDPLVHSLQDELRQAGFYAGPVDGLTGPQTQAAITAFERSAGRLAVGEPTPDILAAIQTYAPRTPDQPPTAVPAASQGVPTVAAGDPQIAAVQGALAKAAYGPLLADGVLGRQTREAIIRFQRDRGLPITGEISDALVVELRAAGALDGD